MAFELELAERRQAEERLRLADAELTAISTSVPVALLIVDRDRRVSKVSHAAAQLAGRGAGEMLGFRAGEALRCLHSLDDPRGCGFGPGCASCQMRLAIADTFADGKGREPVEALFAGGAGEGAKERSLLISTAYLESDCGGNVLVSALDITRRKEAEAALRQSDQRYRSLFENMLDGFAYCKMLYDELNRPVDFVYLEVNPAFEQLTGLHDAVGKRVTELIPGVRESNPELFEIYSRVALIGGHERFEQDVEVELTSRWLEISVYGPATGYFVAVFDDITERKLNEADREAMLSLLRVANSSSDTRELIRTVTAELQRWSGCRAVGVRLQEGDDFPYYETRGFPARFVEAETYLCARDANSEIRRDSQGNPVLECMCGNVLCGRFDARRPFFTAGGSFWTNSTSQLLASTTEKDRQVRTRNRCNGEGYESVALIPLRCGDRTFGLLQFNDPRRDRFNLQRISLLERAAASLAIALEQRRTQAALRASEERYRLISENTADVIWLLDLTSGRYTYVSPSVQRLLGYTPEEVMAKDFAQILTPESSQFVACRITDALARIAAGEPERTETHEVDLLRKDGSPVRIEFAATLLADQPGQALGVSRDISERIQAEARLAQAQKMESVGRLAGGVAHDFNNLLTVINGYSEMLLDDAVGGSLREGLTEIHRAGERAAELTHQLLAFSRKQVMRPRVLDANAVVSGMQPMLQRLMGEDIELRVRLHEGATRICADPHQLEQVIMNLVVNARDAMPHGGTLAIQTTVAERSEFDARLHPGARPGRYVTLAVHDSGAGMTEEVRRHIFEPFFTTKQVGKGTGLGLSMIQGVVEQSGGYIDVQSEPGCGTAFRVHLPRVMEEAEGEEAAEEVAAVRGNETVLVVEDQADVRKFAAAALRAYGYRVIHAGSAVEAISLCEREGGMVDLVLTDVVMPNERGTELASRLRQRWPGINVLFMSGYAGDVRHGELEKSAELIQKPFTPDELARRVRGVLAKQDLRTRR